MSAGTNEGGGAADTAAVAGRAAIGSERSTGGAGARSNHHEPTDTRSTAARVEKMRPGVMPASARPSLSLVVSGGMGRVSSTQILLRSRQSWRSMQGKKPHDITNALLQDRPVWFGFTEFAHAPAALLPIIFRQQPGLRHHDKPCCPCSTADLERIDCANLQLGTLHRPTRSPEAESRSSIAELEGRAALVGG